MDCCVHVSGVAGGLRVKCSSAGTSARRWYDECRGEHEICSRDVGAQVIPHLLTQALFDASCAELVIGDAVAFDATSRELIMGIAQKHSSTSRRVRADKLLLAAGPWTSTVAESLRISR